MRFNVSHLDMLLDERSLPVLHHIFLQKICKWLTQLLLAVDYLHSNRVLHGDLKVLVLPCPGERNLLHSIFINAALFNFSVPTYSFPKATTFDLVCMCRPF